MLAALLHRLKHPGCLSLDWLHEQDRRESRIGFEGVAIRWPISKLKNEHALLNTNKLRAGKGRQEAA